ncbi:MAG: NUDIX hydrolase, partial [Brevundimonas sp.]
HGENGLEVMMITSRETRRWVIPKGGRMVGKTDPQAAAQEAYEEAGIQGETLDAAVGHFRYAKRLKSGAEQACVVAVYPLEVLIQLGAWPEDQQRQRRWMPQAEAADAVHEADLAELIRDFRPTT